MNDTQPLGATTSDDRPGDERGFDARRVRTLVDMRRSRDDRMVAGVCAGVARHLDIDPVIVRVVIAAMTFVGLAGPILYLAAWFLVPSDDAERSIAADWFNLGEHEEQVRTIGLVGAAAVAGLSIIGDSSWGWGPPAFGLLWIAIPAAILYWLFAVRPRRRREAQVLATTLDDSGAVPPDGTEPTAVIPPLPPRPERPRRPKRSHALAGLTLSVVAVVLGALALWDATHASADITWLTYVATALGIVGLGLLVSTVVGHGMWLTPLGILLALALAAGTALPDAKIGQESATPLAASQVRSTYSLGIGELVLDLRQVDDPDALLGRTIKVTQGIGSLRVIVPEGTPVIVRSHVRAGDLQVLGREQSGTDRTIDTVGTPAEALTIDTHLTFGQIKVDTE